MKDNIIKCIDWWLSGLKLLIPRSVKDKVFLRPDRLVINQDEETLVLNLISGERETVLESRKVDTNKEFEVNEIRRWIERLSDKPIETSITITDKEILTKPVILPATNEREIRSILGFEMDRQTPFKVDQVYYDSKIIERDTVKGKITVMLYITPKQELDKFLDKLKKINVTPHIAGIMDANKDIAGINFLTSNENRINNPVSDMSSKMVLVGTLALLMLALYLPLVFMNGKVERLDAEIASYRNEAVSVQALINEREDIILRSRFLDRKLAENKQMIAIMHELTRILPDNTWLSRLIIRDGEIQIHGESDTAIAIIQIIEDSELFKDAQFRSSVTQNNITRKDRFHVSASIVTGGTS